MSRFASLDFLLRRVVYYLRENVQKNQTKSNFFDKA